MSENIEPPIHRLALESNDFCNQPCGFCFATFKTPPEVATAVHDASPETDTDNPLTTDEVKSLVIEPFAEMKGTILHFTGGDPFLRRDLTELVEYAIGKGLVVSVDTNCLVVTQARNRHLYERVVPQLFRVGIPIDAPNESLQVALRSHRRAYEAPRQFLDMAQEVQPTVPDFPEIKVNTLVTGLNYQQVPAIVDTLEPYIRTRSAQRPIGLIGRWSIDKFLPMERGAANGSPYHIDQDTYRQTVAAARSELAMCGLADIVTGDQPKVNTTLIVSPQGIVYVPAGTEKQFALSVRDTPLGHIIGCTALASRDEQYSASLGGTSGQGLYRHPQWEAEFISPPPW